MNYLAKLTKSSILKYALIKVLLISTLPIIAQQHQPIPLKDYLFQLEKDYKVSIIYKSELTEGKFINTTMIPKGSLEEQLNYLLPPLQLHFQKIADHTYIILPSKLKIIEPSTTFSKGRIKGNIKSIEGEPLLGVNIMINGTTKGGYTDENGNFEINNLKAGRYTLVASYIGYVSVFKKITINNIQPTTTLKITMAHDLLSLKTIIVTGVNQPLLNMNTSIALTNFDKNDLAEIAPYSTADILRHIPGFYVETSGGEVQNNLFSRGMPAEGSYQYIVMQEDGLPIYEAGNIDWVSADNFFRMDGTTRSVEGLRGGSAGIFASNAPGGIINMVSETGGGKMKGEVKLQTSDFGQLRIESRAGGSIKPTWDYHLGGFYRVDNGVRRTGFKANDGGQLKANITKRFNRGFVRISGKYLNDKNVFYLPIPLRNTVKPKGIKGFDPNYGTLTSVNIDAITFPTPEGEKTFDLTDGMHTKLAYIGTHTEIELGDGWTMTNKNRFSKIDKTSNAIISIFNPMLARDYAKTHMTPNLDHHPIYTYVDDGSPFDIHKANENGLVVEAGWWANTNQLQNFINSLEFTKNTEKSTFTMGGYFSYFSNATERHWANMLLEVNGNQPRALDLHFENSSGDIVKYATYNGITDFNSFDKYENTSGVARVLATFGHFNYKILPNLNLDMGFRAENLVASGIIENTKRYQPDPLEIGDELLLSLGSMIYGDGTYTPYDVNKSAVAWSVGANYGIHNNASAFVRFSDGYRMPDFDNWQGRQSNGGQIENVIQAEIGYKYTQDKFAASSTGFFSAINNQMTTDASIDTNGNILPFRTRNSRTYGIELESAVTLSKNFSLQLTATAQKAIYKVSPDQEIDIAFPIDGNDVKRIPRLFFIARPTYTYGNFKLFGSIFYVGNRWGDELNTNFLPAYSSVDIGLTYRHKSYQFLLHAQNLTNSLGLTEGNPRIVGSINAAPTRMARPILGRSIVASVSYEF